MPTTLGDMINRYTIGAAVGLVVLVLVWLQFGGAISAWSAGVGRAIKGNQAAEAELHKTKEDLAATQARNEQVIQEYNNAQAAMQVLTDQIARQHKETETAKASAQVSGQRATQLERRVADLEAARKARPRATTLEEAFHGLQALGPPYRR